MVTLKNLGNGNYSQDQQILTNGILGSPLYNNGEWIGFSSTNFEAVVDLETRKTVSEININVLNYQWQKMHPPKEFTIEISDDNVNFMEVSRQTKFSLEGINAVSQKINPVKARFIKVKATNIGLIPDGFYGAGTQAWLLVDEIIIK